MKILEFDKLLDHVSDLAITNMGKERILNSKPIHDHEALIKEQYRVTDLRDVLLYEQQIPLDRIYDYRKSLEKLRIANSVLQVEELIEIYYSLVAIRKLKEYFASIKDKIQYLKIIVFKWMPLKAVEKEIETCIDINTSEIKDTASPQLVSIRKQLERSQRVVRQKIEKILTRFTSQDVLQEKVISVRNGRLVLMVKDEYKRKIKGLVHDRSSSGSSYFIEPLETVEDNNRVRELQVEEQHEIQRILAELSGTLRENYKDLKQNQELFARFDSIYAKAEFSRRTNANPPNIVNESQIELYQARHPLLLLRMGEKAVIPFDVNLGKKAHNLIISGPNAGGKTVALKTIGLLTLMTKSGFHIPALPHSKIGTVEHVFAVIGDQQSIENDLSTFSSHLNDLKTICSKADNKSLVLIDEIGSGTDPEEGSALAMAILEHLLRKQSLTVVTTHQSALKAFGYETNGVENASMEFDVDTLTPTYRFRTGVPGSSYAYEIARRMGLPEFIIDRAKQFTGMEKNKLEGLILELEEKVQKYKNLSTQASLKETEYRGLETLYRQRMDKLKKEEKDIKKQAVLKADEILKNANATIERTIREIRQQGIDKDNIRNIRKSFDNDRKNIQIQKNKYETRKEPVTRATKFSIGDTVRWKTFGSEGVVLTETDKDGKVLLQTGGIKIQAPVHELEKSASRKKAGSVRFNLQQDDYYKDELDLRGLETDQARQVVDKFLDRAILSGFKQVRIIHGKGTGKLRDFVGQYLTEHPRIKNMRLGRWNEGDTGVTVVELE